MNECIRERETKVGNVGARLKLLACLFANDTVLLEEGARELKKTVNEHHNLPEKKGKS